MIATAKALAAKRIASDKFFNAGQTCMCPDYAHVEESIMPDFLEHLKLVSTCSYCSYFHIRRIGVLTYLDLDSKLTSQLDS